MITIFRRHRDVVIPEPSQPLDREQDVRAAVLRRLCQDYPALSIREVGDALDAAWGVVPVAGEDALHLVEPLARERLDAARRRRVLAEQRVRRCAEDPLWTAEPSPEPIRRAS